MVTKTSEIKVRFIRANNWWESSKWELLEDYVSANGHITATAGFVTDGASIPDMLKFLFSPTGRYFGAAIIHDFILVDPDVPASKDTWNTANTEFKAEMEALGIIGWRLNIILTSVESYGMIRTNIVNRF